MEHFVPLRDDLMEALNNTKLVPYRVGLPCLHWEAAIADPRSEKTLVEFISGKSEAVRRAPHSDDSRCPP